ncbi:hypothetical protein [Rickettsiella endosymbiont of Aleochara curtula]|uniref:hypothetical protein n=1 Tax=Rickettsiella endosymbiont of Aleochara curtula TaxID=3077936 RepID=UPI00313C5546
MKNLKYSILLTFPFLLVACGPPSIFGIPQDQWGQLNQQQKSKVIEGYNQRTKTEAQVAPIYAVVDALKARNSAAKPDKPADPFPDHNPMMDPDPEIDKAYQAPEFSKDNF